MKKLPYSILIWYVLSCWVALPASAQSQNRLAPGKKPVNVLFIAVDDLRNELGCYGQSHIISPHIDKLAARGMVFERAYCQQAVCSPSRTSLLTGLRPATTKVTDLRTHFRNTIPAAVTLPQYFRQQGYHTFSMGKIFHNGLDDSLSWSEPSWWPASKGERYVKQENRDRVKNKEKGPAYESADAPDNAYLDGKVAEHAVEALKKVQNSRQPFFMAVGFSKPHLPFAAPRKYWDLYDAADIKLADNPDHPRHMPEIALTNSGEMRAAYTIPPGVVGDTLARHLRHGYYACVSFVDAQIGKVLTELQRLGLEENTIVILWGDHGFKLGEYREWGKHTNFELDARVPLLLSYPGMKQPGKKTNGIVELIDVYPSLCELAGLPVPDGLEGRSFVPLLESPEKPWKPAAFSQHTREFYKRDQYPNRDVMGYSVRTDRYRFTRWQRGPAGKPGEVIATELYDYQKGPREKVNLAGDPAYAALVREMTVLLEKGGSAALPE